ncbi:MAG: type II toxin-antitoxin system MqsA family antitoxin [Cyclobacteriaceae bacterium]|nr:type II toxin-antitoxin system MqsA family antitoxin [Cyclobacteriaceae bacterium]
MNCIICKQGETKKGYTTVTLNRGDSSIIIKKVPADICENCGEYYLSEEISEQVLKLAEKAIERNAEIEVLRFAA